MHLLAACFPPTITHLQWSAVFGLDAVDPAAAAPGAAAVPEAAAAAAAVAADSFAFLRLAASSPVSLTLTHMALKISLASNAFLGNAMRYCFIDLIYHGILSILKKISNYGKYDGCDVSCIPGQPPLLQLPEALLRGVELVGEVLYPVDQHPLLLFV